MDNKLFHVRIGMCAVMMVCGLAIWLNNGLASGQSARGPSLSTVASPEESTSPAAAAESVKKSDLLASLTIFALAIFVGFEIITKVPPTLHTPLMSGSNAISGITLVGALIVAGVGMQTSSLLGMFAVILATINVVGGFLVTHRMLAMFKRR